jgi:ACS family hexuronate transporter-like MFS transporter
VSASPAVSPLRWRMISLAFWATAINYLDRQALSVAAPALRERFHMSNVDYGHVVAAFLLAYTIMNGVSGPVIDRLGTRLGYGLCVAWWSVSAMLHAFSRGTLSLGVFRFLLGMGEAGNWPAAVKVVAEWFPENERALAAGVFNSGSAAGAILAPPIVAFLLLRFGWQSAFVFTGVAGLVWLAFWFRMYRSPGGDSGQTAPPVPVRVLVRTRFVRAFTASKIFFDSVWYFYIFWFPEYLKHARNFDLAAIGKFAWIPFLVAGFGNILGGWLSSWLLRRGCSVTIARKSAITFFTVLMMSAIPAVLVPQAWLSIGFVSVAMFGYTGALANMLTLPADVFPKHAVGSVYGLASMGAGFGGMVFTTITGWVVEHYSYTPVFIGFGFVPLVCSSILWLFLGPLVPNEALTGTETNPAQSPAGRR